jgi:hypothetical protein
MKRFWFGSLAALAVLACLTAGPLFAQAPSAIGPSVAPPSTYNPAVSPYLNLLRPGGSTFSNYYGFVVPQLDTQRAVNQLNQGIVNNHQNINGLQQQLQANQQGQQTQTDTGNKPVGFMTHTRYFGNGSTGTSSTGRRR